MATASPSRVVLAIRPHYTTRGNFWALFDGDTPIVLFRPTARGFSRASKLLTEVRDLMHTAVASSRFTSSQELH